jgi:hypothetical protein
MVFEDQLIKLSDISNQLEDFYTVNLKDISTYKLGVFEIKYQLKEYSGSLLNTGQRNEMIYKIDHLLNDFFKLSKHMANGFRYSAAFSKMVVYKEFIEDYLKKSEVNNNLISDIENKRYETTLAYAKTCFKRLNELIKNPYEKNEDIKIEFKNLHDFIELTYIDMEKTKKFSVLITKN